jgi:hypothetical protein
VIIASLPEYTLNLIQISGNGCIYLSSIVKIKNKKGQFTPTKVNNSGQAIKTNVINRQSNNGLKGPKYCSAFSPSAMPHLITVDNTSVLPWIGIRLFTRVRTHLTPFD